MFSVIIPVSHIMKKTYLLIFINLFLFLALANLLFSYRNIDDKYVLKTYAYLNYSADKKNIKEIKHLKFDDPSKNFRHQLRMANIKNYPLYSNLIFYLEKNFKFSQPFTIFLLLQFANHLLALLILIYIILNYTPIKQRINLLMGIFISWAISVCPVKILELLPFQSFDYSATVAYPRGPALIYFLSFALLLTNLGQNKNRRRKIIVLAAAVFVIGFLSHIASIILFSGIYLLTVFLTESLWGFRKMFPNQKTIIILLTILSGCFILFHFKLISPNHLKTIAWLIGTLILIQFYLYIKPFKNNQENIFFNLFMLSAMIILTLQFFKDYLNILETWQISPYLYLLFYEIPVRLAALTQLVFWICFMSLFSFTKQKLLNFHKLSVLIIFINVCSITFQFKHLLIFNKNFIPIKSIRKINNNNFKNLKNETLIYQLINNYLTDTVNQK